MLDLCVHENGTCTCMKQMQVNGQMQARDERMRRSEVKKASSRTHMFLLFLMVHHSNALFPSLSPLACIGREREREASLLL